MKLKIDTYTHQTFQTSLNSTQLREILKKAGFEIPLNARFFVEVPGGGDWSGTELDIDDEVPLQIEWAESNTVEKEIDS